jgi:predicted RNA-binding protein with PUA-like domain
VAWQRKPKRAAGPPREGGAWDWVFLPRVGVEKRYWLVKSEPGTFSFDDLMARPDRTTHWDGVRNYTARTFMRDGMKLGDPVFFYHSNADPSAIVGICEVVREGYPDSTALDRDDPHFDPDSDPKDPKWFMVDLRAVRALPRPLPLPELRARKELAGMALLRIGRLSVSPIRPAEWEVIMGMAGSAGRGAHDAKHKGS